jgi:hypothetical protein
MIRVPVVGLTNPMRRVKREDENGGQKMEE